MMLPTIAIPGSTRERVIQKTLEYLDGRNALRAEEGDPPLSFGSTELGRLISAADGDITGTTIQLPTFGYHSNSETTSTLAIDHLLRLLGNVLKLDLP